MGIMPKHSVVWEIKINEKEKNGLSIFLILSRKITPKAMLFVDLRSKYLSETMKGGQNIIFFSQWNYPR